MTLMAAVTCAAHIMGLGLPSETHVSFSVAPVSNQECARHGRPEGCSGIEGRMPGSKIMFVRLDPRYATWRAHVHAACHILQVEHDLPYPAEWQCERVEERALECRH